MRSILLNIFIYHEHHAKQISKQSKLNCLKSESEGATNKMPTCVVPVHDPQANTLL